MKLFVSKLFFYLELVVKLPHIRSNLTKYVVMFYGTICLKIIFPSQSGGKITTKQL